MQASLCRGLLAGAACLLLLLPAAAGDAPVKPFGNAGKAAGRKATVIHAPLGRLAEATVEARADLRISFYAPEEREHLSIPFADLAALEVTVLDEGIEREWRWKEGGSNEKIHTGRDYPWRKYGIILEFAHGTRRRGRLDSGFPLTISYRDAETNERVERKFVVKPRDKGAMGRELKELGYIRRIEFLPPKETSDAP